MQQQSKTDRGLSSILAGRTATYSVDPFAFPVEIRAAKVLLGRLKLFVAPLTDSAERVALRGECWVDASKVRLT